MLGCPYTANGDGVKSPLLEDAEDLVLAAFLGHQQHALLRFAQHDFVRSHAGLALGHQVELNLHPTPPRPPISQVEQVRPAAPMSWMPTIAPVCMASRQASSNNFFQERVADLHVGPLGLRLFAKLFAGHGGAVNSITPGLGADVNHRITFAGSLGVEDLVATHQSQRKRVHQRISGVAAFELHLAANVGNAKAVSVRRDAAHNAFQHRMVLDAAWPGRRAGLRRDGAETKRVHDGDRTRSHGEDVAQDAANTGGRALEGLDERRMIVRLDLEGAGPAVADVDDAGVLPGPCTTRRLCVGSRFKCTREDL